MSGSRRRLKVKWMADGPTNDAHAYRLTRGVLAERSECNLPRVQGMRETKRNQCAHCKYSVNRDHH